MNFPLQAPRMRAAVRRVKAGGERFLGGVLPGATARRLQVAAFADEWAAANLDARGKTGPLWIVLGDSISQGIGATTREAGYVGVVHEMLRRRDAWRVINLSRAEAGVLDVLARQLPTLNTIAATQEIALVTCLIGAEDMARRTPGLDTALRQVISALPTGSVIGLLPHGPRAAGALNSVIREEAERHAMRIAVLPPRLPGQIRGRDNRGLGDVGHAAWARAVLSAADGPVAVAAPATDPRLPIVPPVEDHSPPTDPAMPVVPPLDAVDTAASTDPGLALRTPAFDEEVAATGEDAAADAAAIGSADPAAATDVLDAGVLAAGGSAAEDAGPGKSGAEAFAADSAADSAADEFVAGEPVADGAGERWGAAAEPSATAADQDEEPAAGARWGAAAEPAEETVSSVEDPAEVADVSAVADEHAAADGRWAAAEEPAEVADVSPVADEHAAANGRWAAADGSAEVTDGTIADEHAAAGDRWAAADEPVSADERSVEEPSVDSRWTAEESPVAGDVPVEEPAADDRWGIERPGAASTDAVDDLAPQESAADRWSAAVEPTASAVDEPAADESADTAGPAADDLAVEEPTGHRWAAADEAPAVDEPAPAAGEASAEADDVEESTGDRWASAEESELPSITGRRLPRTTIDPASHRTGEAAAVEESPTPSAEFDGGSAADDRPVEETAADHRWAATEEPSVPSAEVRADSADAEPTPGDRWSAPDESADDRAVDAPADRWSATDESTVGRTGADSWAPVRDSAEEPPAAAVDEPAEHTATEEPAVRDEWAPSADAPTSLPAEPSAATPEPAAEEPVAGGWWDAEERPVSWARGDAVREPGRPSLDEVVIENAAVEDTAEDAAEGTAVPEAPASSGLSWAERFGTVSAANGWVRPQAAAPEPVAEVEPVADDDPVEVEVDVLGETVDDRPEQDEERGAPRNSDVDLFAPNPPAEASDAPRAYGNGDRGPNESDTDRASGYAERADRR